MAPMINILTLLRNLQENNWHITAFQFTYKTIHYTVLFEDISNLPLTAGDYVVLLTFINRENGNQLQTKANEFKFSVGAKEFRKYFGIQFAPNLGNIFKQFYMHFGTFIPEERVKAFDTETQLAMVHKLSQNDHDNENNLCCYAVRRNGIYNGRQHHRTPFNSDKTKLLRENLFNMLGKNDDTISFCYREENPLEDAEICAQFAQQEQLRQSRV